MPKRLLCSLALLLCVQALFAQNSSITGTVSDTANQKKLANALISVVKKTDSTLLKFVRSDKDGNFSIKNLDTGNIIVMISYPKFADYVDFLELTPGKELNIGSINLINESKLLDEIVIRQNNAMRMKGDTLEFTADSFKVRANANAEDLLKTMPGIQVDKNGKIMAQGQEVQKVLVDGEEFFSDDPTVATRNIRADAVDKVQVFDKKSDQATFSGIDDGEKTKTINLKLKEDKKNGYFGRVSAGGGLKDKFHNEAMINFFKAKRKISAFGIMSNIDANGLNWQDRAKYGGADDSFEYDDDNGGFSFGFSGGDGLYFNGNGLPKLWTAGAHYSNKWNENKHNFNTSYTYKKMNIDGIDDTRTQYILPDTLYYMNQRNRNFSQRMRNSINGKYEVQLDSSNTLKITFNGFKGISENINNFYQDALNDKMDTVNLNRRNTSSRADESAVNTTVLWRKKFTKLGRTLSVRFEQSYNNSDGAGFLDAVTDYFNPGGEIFQKDTINQRKYNHSISSSVNGKVTYTEPLSKDNFLTFNYGYSYSNNRADRQTYDYNYGKYDEQNPLLTNDYNFLITINAGGLAYRIAKKKYNFSMGSDIAYQDYKQTDKLVDTAMSYNRVNLFPKANFTYNLKPQTRIGMSYNGRTIQPTIQQIQPIIENNDPLNIYAGNPDLDPAFNHNLMVYFNDYKTLKQRGIYLQANINVIDNAITNSSTVDTLGKRTYKSVNAGTMYNYRTYAGYNIRLTKLKTSLYFNLSTNGGKSISFINDQKNTTDNQVYSGGLGLYHSTENKFGLELGGGMDYNTSVSSIRKEVKTAFWTQRYNIDTWVALPGKFDIGTQGNFNIRQKTSVFDANRNAFIWNASLSKRLFKETCSLKFAVNDILNQNIGFNRNINSNFVTENTYTTLRRYWLLSFTWNFTKNNAQTQTPQ